MVMVCGARHDGAAFDGSTKIAKYDGRIELDCGAAHGGRLGCLCLDNGEEFYL